MSDDMSFFIILDLVSDQVIRLPSMTIQTVRPAVLLWYL